MDNDAVKLDTGHYLPDPDLVAAAKVALTLGQPLLLTGEPGTGKSSFARYVAQYLAPQFLKQSDTIFPLYTFETKSTSVATDLFYRFDSLRRYHAVHDKGMSGNNIDYISFEALGRAILESLAWSEVSDLLIDQHEHHGPRRSVVLIDEVDKAPRDFPNDLLNEIEQMYFRIPELSNGSRQGVRCVQADPASRPIVILTSNSEKNLPAPFLRRCIFHHIRFPEETERLGDIVRANIAEGSDELTAHAITFFYDIRQALQLDKLPTTSELIQWVRVLHSMNTDGAYSTLADFPPEQFRATLGVLGKTANDLALIEEMALHSA